MRIVMICRLCRPLSPILVGLLLLMACGPGAAFAEGSPTTESPDAAIQIPTTTPIKHLVSIMQSNHSFDSLFGTYPGVDGIPANACMPVDPNMRGGDCVPPFAMTNNGADFDHTHNTFKNQYRDGENNGFISSFRQRGEDGTLAMGHYTEADIPFSYAAANEYVLFDQFFTSASAGSLANRMFWVTGTPGNSDINDTAIPSGGWGDLPTIFDQLQQSGVSWKFYVENYNPAMTFENRGDGSTSAQVNWVPLLSFGRFVNDPNLSSHIVNLDQYFIDLENNQLPAVSYVVTVGSSGHPPSSLLASERMLNRMVSALMMSPAWDTSVIQWAYDDWGGWYDHVAPPQVDEYGYGFRTAAQVVSPFAKKGYIDSELHDFTSILAFIETNWTIPPLSSRDAGAVSIATALDFNQPPRAPYLLSMSQEAEAILIPKRSGIYLTYGVALGSAVIVIGFTFLSLRRKKGRVK